MKAVIRFGSAVAQRFCETMKGEWQGADLCDGGRMTDCTHLAMDSIVDCRRSCGVC